MKEQERVRVLRGDHEGRTGTVSVLPTHPYATYLKIGPGSVLIALDGEPARGAEGGRGGSSIVVPIEDLEPYDGPAGHARDKHVAILDLENARIVGCRCGWRTPPGIPDSEETFVEHVAKERS